MNTAAPTLGLYLHIPFCRQKCVYCDFYSLAHRESSMDAYTDALCLHLTQASASASSYCVDTVYFGGGTPSYLGAERLSRILSTVQHCFRLSPQAEITLEANPDSACSIEALRTLRAAGFNRVSLGMQSACDEELRSIGRIHTASQTAEAVAAIRAAGFENLSLDLIYGLPGQTMDRWKENLAAAVALAPEHLSCYGLKVEEGTPLFAMKERLTLPDDEAQADMYLYTVSCLSAAGYEQYEISNFAGNGRVSRHNLKYWQLDAYMGFGPGAHSDFGGKRYAFTRDLAAYVQGVQNGAPPLSECVCLSDGDRAAEWLMLGLRTARGLDPAEFERRFSLSFDRFLPFLHQCLQAGYALHTDGRWHLSAQGFLLSNQIIAALLDQLDENA